MSAATVAVFDSAHLETLEKSLDDSRMNPHQLLDTIANLRNDNQALLWRNRELERELMVTRLDSGEIPLPNTIGDTFTAEVWLVWARKNFHTDACACRRCTAARRALST